MTRRALALVAAAGVSLTGVAMAVGAAEAEIVHEISSQDYFGISESGEDASTPADPEYGEAWQLFVNSVEGARILGKIDANRDVVVRVEVKPADEIEYRDPETGELVPVWGLMSAKGPIEGTDQQLITIEIALDDRDPKAIAETLYHEFRHVEHYIEDADSDEGHDAIHGYTDDRFLIYLDEIRGVRAASEVPTPIYDALTGNTPADRQFYYDTLALGEAFEITGPWPSTSKPPTYVHQTETFIVGSIDIDMTDLLEQTLERLEPVDSDERCTRDDDSTACGNQPGFGPDTGDVLIGTRFAADLPTGESDVRLEVFVAADSDGDASNNHVPRGQNDPYQGTDSWFQMVFEPDADQWRFQTWLVGDGGSGVNPNRDSEAFGILQGDWMWFVLPADELPAEFPLVRTGIVAETGEAKIADVNGELPTDPPISLNGSRVFGSPTAVASTDDEVIVYFGPTIVPSGGVLSTGFCLYGVDGAPQSGVDVATTLGLDPGGNLASHNSGSTDDLGCIELPLDVKERPGSSTLWFFDGSDVNEVETIILIEPSRIELDEP